MVGMIDYLASHAAIDADILTCNETGLPGVEKQHHVGARHDGYFILKLFHIYYLCGSRLFTMEKSLGH